MWLVVCEPDDVPALWAARGLQVHGAQDVEIALPGELVAPGSFSHRLAGVGSTSHIRLGGDLDFDDEDITGVLNRLRADVNDAHRLDPVDRQYIEDELRACLAAWLASLECPVVNPAHPIYLTGETMTVPEWRMRARDAGFLIAPYRISTFEDQTEDPTRSRATALVIGQHVFLPPVATDFDLESACQALATLVGTPVIEVDLIEQDGWVFDQATPFADFRLGGSDAIHALDELLSSNDA